MAHFIHLEWKGNLAVWVSFHCCNGSIFRHSRSRNGDPLSYGYRVALYCNLNVDDWYWFGVHEYFICHSCAKRCSLEFARRSDSLNPICAYYGWYGWCCCDGNNSQRANGTSLCTDL